MPVEDPGRLDPVDREIRLNELKHRIGAVDAQISADCPPETAEAFLDSVERWENAPWTTEFELLQRAGLELPPSEELDDAQLTAKLWELIAALARLRTFVERTDHLSDRELYEHLWRESLREGIKDFPLDEYSAHHLDILGGCSEEDLHLALKYYMSEDERRDWQAQFPNDEIPDHVDPPYDRDRRLPQVSYGPRDGR